MSIEKIKSMIESKKYHVGDWGKNGYKASEILKKEIIDLHYSSNISLNKLAIALDVSVVSISNWKKKYGNQLTAIKYNKRVQYDVRTKCIIVAEALSGATKYGDIAAKYDISYSTLMSYIKLYRDDYEQYIDGLPDGVPYIVREEKLVYGTKNVLEARESIRANIEMLKNVLNTIELTSAEKNIISTLVGKEESKESEIDSAMKMLLKHGIKLS